MDDANAKDQSILAQSARHIKVVTSVLKDDGTFPNNAQLPLLVLLLVLDSHIWLLLELEYLKGAAALERLAYKDPSKLLETDHEDETGSQPR